MTALKDIHGSAQKKYNGETKRIDSSIKSQKTNSNEADNINKKIQKNFNKNDYIENCGFDEGGKTLKGAGQHGNINDGLDNVERAVLKEKQNEKSDEISKRDCFPFRRNKIFEKKKFIHNYMSPQTKSSNGNINDHSGFRHLNHYETHTDFFTTHMLDKSPIINSDNRYNSTNKTDFPSMNHKLLKNIYPTKYRNSHFNNKKYTFSKNKNKVQSVNSNNRLDNLNQIYNNIEYNNFNKNDMNSKNNNDNYIQKDLINNTSITNAIKPKYGISKYNEGSCKGEEKSLSHNRCDNNAIHFSHNSNTKNKVTLNKMHQRYNDKGTNLNGSNTKKKYNYKNSNLMYKDKNVTKENSNGKYMGHDDKCILTRGNFLDVDCPFKSQDTIDMGHHSFKIIQFLGKGTFGVVLRCLKIERSKKQNYSANAHDDGNAETIVSDTGNVEKKKDDKNDINSKNAEDYKNVKTVAIKVLRNNLAENSYNHTNNNDDNENKYDFVEKIAYAQNEGNCYNRINSNESLVLSHITSSAQSSTSYSSSSLPSSSSIKYNIVKFYEEFHYKGLHCIVFEDLAINLYDYLKRSNYKPLLLQHIRPIAQQILVALSKLKSLSIIHTDLKPENIVLVDPVHQPFKVRVIDFGSACYTSQITPSSLSYLQSRYYRAPEILIGLPINEAIDMWSLGCLLCELFLGWPLYPGSSEYDQIRYIMHTQGFYDQQTLNVASKTCFYFSSTPPVLTSKTCACNSQYQTGQYLLETVKPAYMAGGSGVVCGHQPVFNDNVVPRWSLKHPCTYERETGVKSKETRKYLLHSLDHLALLNVPQNSTAAEHDFHMRDTSQFVGLIKEILQLHSTSRITPLDALKHPFITLDEKAYCHFKEISEDDGYVEGSDDNDFTPCIHLDDKQAIKDSPKTYQSVNTYECLLGLDDGTYHCNTSNNHGGSDGDDNGVSEINGVKCDDVDGGVASINQLDSGITQDINGDGIKQGDKFYHNDWDRITCSAYLEEWRMLLKDHKKKMDVCNVLSSHDVEQIRQQNNLQQLEPLSHIENNAPHNATLMQHILTYAPYNNVTYLPTDASSQLTQQFPNLQTNPYILYYQPYQQYSPGHLVIPSFFPPHYLTNIDQSFYPVINYSSIHHIPSVYPSIYPSIYPSYS